MTLEQFAQTILFGTTLEAKLTTAVDFDEPSATPVKAMAEVPPLPSRPAGLANFSKAHFPSLQLLQEPKSRGEVLHFFANHELLALELMALVLLRFPEAPHAFRVGLARTIQEEQEHLKLYIGRMRELGVEFGDLPVSDYFWKTMSGVSSPLDFVVQMSLTFEQANLDFSLFFRDEIAKVGDEKTAAILDQVYREEIGHVKHGLTWFNRWRDNPDSESDWDAYTRLLPRPMTPRRAKGFGYCETARRQAGLSETFIRELKLCGGSKGRPPAVWLFNPHCDAEIARGRAGFSPTEGSKRMTEDLEHVPMFLALDKDVVLVKKRPRPEWLEELARAGFLAPEFSERVRSPKIGGLEPWGWSPDVFENFRPLRSRLAPVSGANTAWSERILAHSDFADTGLGKLFSKSWSSDFLRQWMNKNSQYERFFGSRDLVGCTFRDLETAHARIHNILNQGHFVMVKAPYGTSGTAVRRVQNATELLGPLGGWIKNTIASQGAIIIEHWLAKTCDLSIQLVVEEDRIQLLEARRFITGARNEYRGTLLGKRLSGFDSEHLRFLHSTFEAWHKLVRDLGAQLKLEGYRGPAGVDALVWRDQHGSLKLKPLVELNPRWTMGRVALELEAHLAPGRSGLWVFLPVRELKARGFADAFEFAEHLEQKYPLRLIQAGAGMRVETGVVFTNDPATAQEVLTVLATLPNPELEEFLKELST